MISLFAGKRRQTPAFLESLDFGRRLKELPHEHERGGSGSCSLTFVPSNEGIRSPGRGIARGDGEDHAMEVAV
jgi:hypothetical protein